MNYKGEVTLAWGDGEHTFCLPVARLLELEEKCDAPIATIFARVSGGAFCFADIYETLRLGLIGGGKTPVEAKKLADRYVLPLADNVPVARIVIAGVMFGFQAAPLGDQQPGNPQAAPGEASQSASTPQRSSEMPASLASVLESWDRPAFGNSSP